MQQGENAQPQISKLKKKKRKNSLHFHKHKRKKKFYVIDLHGNFQKECSSREEALQELKELDERITEFIRKGYSTRTSYCLIIREKPASKAERKNSLESYQQKMAEWEMLTQQEMLYPDDWNNIEQLLYELIVQRGIFI